MRRWQTEVQLAQDWDSQDEVDNNRVLASTRQGVAIQVQRCSLDIHEADGGIAQG